jgi:hypothetical protein
MAWGFAIPKPKLWAVESLKDGPEKPGLLRLGFNGLQF